MRRNRYLPLHAHLYSNFHTTLKKSYAKRDTIENTTNKQNRPDPSPNQRRSPSPPRHRTSSAITQNSKRSLRQGMSSVCAFPFVMATSLTPRSFNASNILRTPGNRYGSTLCRACRHTANDDSTMFDGSVPLSSQARLRPALRSSVRFTGAASSVGSASNCWLVGAGWDGEVRAIA